MTPPVTDVSEDEARKAAERVMLARKRPWPGDGYCNNAIREADVLARYVLSLSSQVEKTRGDAIEAAAACEALAKEHLDLAGRPGVAMSYVANMDALTAIWLNFIFGDMLTPELIAIAIEANLDVDALLEARARAQERIAR